MKSEVNGYYKDRITKVIKALEDEKQLRVIWSFIRTYLEENKKDPQR